VLRGRFWISFGGCFEVLTSGEGKGLVEMAGRGDTRGISAFVPAAWRSTIASQPYRSKKSKQKNHEICKVGGILYPCMNIFMPDCSVVHDILVSLKPL